MFCGWLKFVPEFDLKYSTDAVLGLENGAGSETNLFSVLKIYLKYCSRLL